MVFLLFSSFLLLIKYDLNAQIAGKKIYEDEEKRDKWKSSTEHHSILSRAFLYRLLEKDVKQCHCCCVFIFILIPLKKAGSVKET